MKNASFWMSRSFPAFRRTRANRSTTPVEAEHPDEHEPAREADTMIHALGWCIVGGGAMVLLFALGAPARSFISQLGGGLALGAAAIVCGALFGFLFGIPRALQHSGAPEAGGSAKGAGPDQREQPSEYVANTSLEQVSDWLTKILVGLGLTQLLKLPEAMESFSSFVGPKLFDDNTGRAQVFVGAEALYFSIIGFLLAYLWTRLYLAGALEKAALMKLITEVDKMKEKGDREALQDVDQQLIVKAEEVDLDRLARRLANATDPCRARAWERARDARKAARNDAVPSPLVQRTIRVFEALIKANEINRHRPYHQNEGEIGFAWYDLTPVGEFGSSTAQNCIDHLTKAIEQRGNATRPYWTYELVRALARIRAQNESGKTLEPELATQIRDDLSVVGRFVRLDGDLTKELGPDLHSRDVDDAKVLREWMEKNPIRAKSSVNAAGAAAAVQTSASGGGNVSLAGSKPTSELVVPE